MFCFAHKLRWKLWILSPLRLPISPSRFHIGSRTRTCKIKVHCSNLTELSRFYIGSGIRTHDTWSVGDKDKFTKSAYWPPTGTPILWGHAETLIRYFNKPPPSSFVQKHCIFDGWQLFSNILEQLANLVFYTEP